MAVVQTLIGNVKGPQGDTGATGAQGAQGDAATIEVGSVTTAAYGTAASVTNSGTENEAVLDFVIPQGAPGETVTDMQNLTLGSITSSSASFPVPVVGETAKVIFGKINKWFSDMAALVATKFDTANVVNNLTTTSSGYALDARQGKALEDKFQILRGVLTGNVSKALPSGGSTMTTVTTVDLPSSASKYLCLGYAQISVAVSGGLLQMNFAGRMVRGDTRNGGGIVGYGVVDGGTQLVIQGYVSSDVANATMAVQWHAIPLY